MGINIISVIIVLAIVVGSVILHELAHGVVAYWLGDRTAKEAGRLTFNPIKHIDPIMSILVPVVLYLLNAPVFSRAILIYFSEEFQQCRNLWALSAAVWRITI